MINIGYSRNHNFPTSHAHSHAHAHALARTRTRTHTRTHKHRQTHRHADTHTQTHTHARTHACMHKHTRVHTPARRGNAATSQRSQASRRQAAWHVRTSSPALPPRLTAKPDARLSTSRSCTPNSGARKKEETARLETRRAIDRRSPAAGSSATRCRQAMTCTSDPHTKNQI